jgi:hypothetical protein
VVNHRQRLALLTIYAINDFQMPIRGEKRPADERHYLYLTPAG